LKETLLSTWKDKLKIKHSYDVTAPIYNERYGKEQKSKYCKALEKSRISGKVVLDVGCGSGLFFERVAPDSEIVIGIDISKKLLYIAHQQAKLFSNVIVLLADVDNLPFPDYSFEVIFGFTVLQNLPKPTETLREIKRVKSSTGRVVVTGLKKAFPLVKFMDILEDSGLGLVEFLDEENINCYIAVLSS
jgi:ubiquinone/menaquinone biosynthesis C-methylase UbiE